MVGILETIGLLMAAALGGIGQGIAFFVLFMGTFWIVDWVIDKFKSRWAARRKQ